MEKKEKNRLSVIITKGGDRGTTSLGGGQRVLKSHLRIEAYGSIDELNSIIGLVRNVATLPTQLHGPLEKLQHDLFTLGGELCFNLEDLQKYNVAGITPEYVERLEVWAEEFNKDLSPLEEFILPAGPNGAAELHMARTICRRAERNLVALSQEEELRPDTISFLNRLSDLLFIWSRWVLETFGETPTLWVRPENTKE